jgi:hypothetical protein
VAASRGGLTLLFKLSHALSSPLECILLLDTNCVDDVLRLPSLLTPVSSDIVQGWQHVGDRLISATVEYEETGWYDGQTWVKTPQVLMRDRLLSNYTVKPALARLKSTLLGLGGALVTSMLLLSVLQPPPVNSAGYAFNDSSSYVSSSSAAAAVSSSGDYDAAVQKYEPWAAEEAGSDAADDADVPRYDMHTHMMLQ